MWDRNPLNDEHLASLMARPADKNGMRVYDAPSLGHLTPPYQTTSTDKRISAPGELSGDYKEGN